jgi:hypothetical protein
MVLGARLLSTELLSTELRLQVGLLELIKKIPLIGCLCQGLTSFALCIINHSRAREHHPASLLTTTHTDHTA